VLQGLYKPIGFYRNVEWLFEDNPRTST